MIDTKTIAGYFCPADHAVFERVVGSSLEALLSDMAELPSKQWDAVFSDSKILDWPDLNKKGLHVCRALLAERVLDAHVRNSGLWDTLEHRKYIKYGYLVCNDFLDEAEFARVFETRSLPRHAIRRIRHMINHCVGSKRLDEEFEPQTIEAREDHDNQWELHVDTYHPMIKLWFYLNDVSSNHGPLHVVVGSHRNTEGKLKWLYECSTIGCDPGHPEFRRRNMSDRVGGSFRVDIGGDTSTRLSQMGFEEETALEANANTLILVDTGAFHRRGVTQKGYARRMLHASHRVTPFETLFPRPGILKRGLRSASRRLERLRA